MQIWNSTAHSCQEMEKTRNKSIIDHLLTGIFTSQTGTSIVLYQHSGPTEHKLWTEEMSRLMLSLQTPFCQHTSTVLTHALQDKKAHHITDIYRDTHTHTHLKLVQQLQTVTKALQTTNSVSTLRGEQLKYFKQFSCTMVSFLLTVTPSLCLGLKVKETVSCNPRCLLQADPCLRYLPVIRKRTVRCTLLCFAHWFHRSQDTKAHISRLDFNLHFNCFKSGICLNVLVLLGLKLGACQGVQHHFHTSNEKSKWLPLSKHVPLLYSTLLISVVNLKMKITKIS